jgi:nucleoside-diphosphate-sugar epimerase
MKKTTALMKLITAIADTLGVALAIRLLPFWPRWSTALACETIYTSFHVAPPLCRRRVDWFRQTRAFNLTKAKTELGHQPKASLNAGLTRTVSWHRQPGYH